LEIVYISVSRENNGEVWERSYPVKNGRKENLSAGKFKIDGNRIQGNVKYSKTLIRISKDQERNLLYGRNFVRYKQVRRMGSRKCFVIGGISSKAGS